MPHEEYRYLDLLRYILENGSDREDRTGVGTRAIFGAQMRFDLSKGFPLLTTKKVWFKGVVHELLWMLSGDTNIKYLVDNGVHIWDEWANDRGELGPVYGAMWRKWPACDGFGCYDDLYGEEAYIDQIAVVIKGLKENPNSRRHIVNAWNPTYLSQQGLPPCHSFFQFFVANDKLSCQMYQRSADMFLGVPFNIASYSILTHMIAQVVGLEVGDFIISFGDAHIYHNHFDQVKEQLSRKPYPFPQLTLNSNVKDIDQFTYEDIKLENYQSHAVIKAPIAV